jgi:hypothetical protein
LRPNPRGPGGASRMPTAKNVGEPCAGEPHARIEAAAGGNWHQVGIAARRWRLPPTLHRARKPTRPSRRLHGEPERRLGRPASPPARRGIRRAIVAVRFLIRNRDSEFYPRLRHCIPERRSRDPAHASASAEGERDRGALRAYDPSRVPRLAPHRQTASTSSAHSESLNRHRPHRARNLRPSDPRRPTLRLTPPPGNTTSSVKIASAD